MYRPVAVIAISLFVILATARAQKVAPEDVPAVVSYGEAFVKAIVDTSTASRTEVIRSIYSKKSLESFSEEKLVGIFEQLRSQYGIVEYHHSEVAYYTLQMFVWSPIKENWLNIQARVDPDPPHRIARVIFIADVAEPVYLPNGPIQSTEVLEWLNGYVDKLVADENLSGAVLIAKGDQPFFERVFGFADADRKREITQETRFNLGSGNKMFTALAIMKLVEDGKLTLEQSIDRFFPDFPYPEFARKATVHHLLSHTSGLGDYWTDEYEKHWGEISELHQMLPFVYDDTVYFAPGASFQYSNSGYILLGLIIEKVTGISYFDYVRQVIYGPLGMNNSDTYLKNRTDIPLALPLSRDGEHWKVAKHGLRGSSAGGGYSTSIDMLRFSRGLISGKIVGEATLRSMITDKGNKRNAPANYGYGFILWKSETQVSSFGHGGQAYGINFELRYYPRFDITTISFCNQDNGAYDSLKRNMAKLITGDR